MRMAMIRLSVETTNSSREPRPASWVVDDRVLRLEVYSAAKRLDVDAGVCKTFLDRDAIHTHDGGSQCSVYFLNEPVEIF